MTEAVSDSTTPMANAEPTKRFFVYMLTKDIGLVPAISDLVDNCIDGARRIRGLGSHGANNEPLWVHIRVSPDQFEIVDNCGGIPLEVASKYAFRFGRPSDMPATPHSVGQFGVGMKRAIFKLGRQFSVGSRTESDSFFLNVDVDEWVADENNWTFPLQTPAPNHEFSSTGSGTVVRVSNLHAEVAQEFGSPSFPTRLRQTLGIVHDPATTGDISISVNGVPVEFEQTALRKSPQLVPASAHLNLEHLGVGVTADLVAGVAQSDPDEAGWSVLLNGRAVLNADKSAITGWGWRDDRGDVPSNPKFHNEFAQFRGYVFLEADDARALPWNTTKTGVDVDHPVYRAVRQQMSILMRPVIDFLGRLADERTKLRDDSGPHARLVAAADATPVRGLVGSNSVFAARVDPIRRSPQTTSIQYSRPTLKVNALKAKLDVSTNRELGERTFDYVFEAEVEET